MNGAQLWWMAVGAVALFWSVGAYSRLQGLRTDIMGAFANLDTQLRRRHEVAARLQGSLRPQRPTSHNALERLLAASAQVLAATQLVKGHPHQSGPIQACSMAEDLFQEAHARLTDELDADPTAPELTDVSAILEELRVADNHARFARGLFNEATTVYNAAIALWPTAALTRLFRFDPGTCLSLSPSRVEAPRPAQTVTTT